MLLLFDCHFYDKRTRCSQNQRMSLRVTVLLMFLICDVSKPKGTIRIFQTYLLYWHAKFCFMRLDSFHVDS